MPSSIGDWYGPAWVIPCCISALRPAVHAQRDLVVLDRGFPVGRLFGFDEFAFEQDYVLGIVELDHVGGRLRSARDARCSPPARADTTRS